MTIVHFGNWQSAELTTITAFRSPEWAGKKVLNPPRSLRNVALALAGRTSWHSSDDICVLWTLAMWKLRNCHHFQLPRAGRQEPLNPPRSLQNVATAVAGRESQHSRDDSSTLWSLLAPQDGPTIRY